MYKLISKCLFVPKGTPLVGLVNLKCYSSKTVAQINHCPSEETRGSACLQKSKHISMLPREERSHQSVMATDGMTLNTKSPFQSKRKRIKASCKSSEGNDDKVSTPSLDIVSRNGYLFVIRRPLTKREVEIVEINKRAVEAFKNGDRDLFAKTALSTTALYVRDDAVRLAAEMNWIEEANELLIKETSDTYRYPVYSAPLSIAFAQLNNRLEVRGGSESRHLLKTAVLSAVKNDREAIFRLLVPVVGIDFKTYNSQDIFYVLTGSELDLSIQMKWMYLIVERIDEKASYSLLKQAIYFCTVLKVGELLPRLLRLLFSNGENPLDALATPFSHAVSRKYHDIARCIIDELRKASIPIDKDFMRSAEGANNVEMIEYLHQNGCNSFPLAVYRECFAQRLRQLLSEKRRDDLYHLIVLK
jgi:hypothetical protein